MRLLQRITDKCSGLLQLACENTVLERDLGKCRHGQSNA